MNKVNRRQQRVIEIVVVGVAAGAGAAALSIAAFPRLETREEVVIGASVMLAVMALVSRLRGGTKARIKEEEHGIEAAGMSAVLTTALVLLIGVVVTALASRTAREQIMRDAGREFERLSDMVRNDTERRNDRFVYGLQGARALFAASLDVDRSEFGAYVSSSHPPTEYSGVEGIGYIERVKRAELPAFSDAVRTGDAPEFVVRTSGEGDELYVVKYVEPLDAEDPWWGLDVGSERAVREAIEEAVRTGKPVLSEWLEVTDEAGREKACVCVVPVQDNHSLAPRGAARAEAVNGLVFARLNLVDMFSGMASRIGGHVRVEVRDVTEGGARAGEVIYDTQAGEATATSTSEDLKRAPLFTSTRTVMVGGRQWRMYISTSPAFEAELAQSIPILITIVGVALSGLAAWMRWSLWHRRARAACDARTMTEALTSAKEHAEQMTRQLQEQSSLVEIERERLELALSGTGLGSWDWNPQTGQAQFDERWAAIVGEDFVRSHIDEWTGRVHPDDLPKARAALADHFAGTTAVYECEHRIRHRDGSWRWIVDRGIVVSRDAEGQPTRIVGTHEDITMRKASEQTLARERSRLATFIEHAPAAVAMFDKDMRYIAVSNRWIAEFRLGTTEVLGISHYDVFPELPVRWKEAHQRALQGSVERCEDDPWRPEGWHYDQHLRWEVRPWNEPDGSVGGLVMFTQDITDQVRIMRELERRGAQLAESEKRFRTLVEGTEVIVWEYDAERDVFTYVSPQAARLGYPLEAWLKPRFWEEHLHEADRDAAIAYCAEEVREKRHHRFQYRMKAADGRVVWIDDFASVEESPRKTPLVRGVFVDITERKTVEETMHQARLAADAANHAKSEFLANMSHEIRTPLTAILGYADLLRDDGELTQAPSRRLQTIDTIRNAGNHLLTIINDILDISKIEAGRMTIEQVETPVVRIMAEVESLVRARATDKGIGLTLSLGSPIPERIKSDPTRLRQILMNLAGNAVKFTSAGHVSVNGRVEDHEGQQRLVIDVADTGPGMTTEQAERLFKPFTQADSTVTRQHGGTGLGLSISRRLARLMGGEVSLVYSRRGEGSCFRIDLPLVAVEGTALVKNLNAVHEQAAAPVASVVTSLVGRVLLAEDGPDNQRLISFHLKKAGATVDVAENGAIALDMIRKADAAGATYDLLVSDMQMPEMDGYTLARTLRAEGNGLAIVALTAHAMAEDHDKCLDAGCDAYSTKPINKPALLGICAQWMGKRSEKGSMQRRAA